MTTRTRPTIPVSHRPAAALYLRQHPDTLPGSLVVTSHILRDPAEYAAMLERARKLGRLEEIEQELKQK